VSTARVGLEIAQITDFNIGK